jgi:hypothetical protein
VSRTTRARVSQNDEVPPNAPLTTPFQTVSEIMIRPAYPG